MYKRKQHFFSLSIIMGVMLTLSIVLGYAAAQNDTVRLATTQQNANVRQTASTKAALVGSLTVGQTVLVLEEDLNGEKVDGNALWYRVRLENGAEGWLWSGVVTVNEVVPTATSTPFPTLPPNPNFQKIAVDNTDQLRLIKEIGRGIPTSVAWSSDGTRLLLSTTTGFWVYDTAHFERGAKAVFSFDFPISDYEMVNIGFVGKSNTVFYVTRNLLQLVNLETQTLGPNIVFNLLPNDSGKAAIAADGQLFALLDRDGIRLLTPIYDSSQKTITGFKEELLRVDYTPTGVALTLDGQKLAVSGNYTLEQTKATGKQGERLQIYSLPDLKILVSGKVSGDMFFSADGSRITFVGTFMRFFTVDAQTGKKLFEYPKTGFQLADADLRPNGTQLAIVYPGLTGIDIYDATQGIVVSNLNERGYGTALAFSPNGKLLANVSANGGTLTIWDVDVNEIVYRDGFIPLFTDTYLDEKGENIAYILGDRVEFQTLSNVSDSPSHEIVLPEWADNFWLSNNGENVFFMGLRVEDNKFIYRTQTWNRDGSPISDVKTFDMVSVGSNTVSSPIRDVDYHPNGKMIAFARQEGFVGLYSIASLEELNRFSYNRKPLTQVKISADGNFVVAGGTELAVWKIEGALVQKIAIPQDIVKREGFDGIRYLSISADGSRVIAGDYSDLLIWDVSSGALIKRISQPDINNHGILDATLHPDGNIVTMTTGRGIVFFDIATGEVLMPSPIANSPITKIAYSGNASTLLGYSGGTGNLYIWGIPRLHQVTPAPAASRIFQDDFEGGSLFKFDNQSGIGSIVEENGNHILHLENNTDGFSIMGFRVDSLSDLRIEARIRIERPTTFYNPGDIFFNIRETNTGGYGVYFSGQVPEFGVLTNLRGFFPWTGGNILSFKPTLHQWFNIRIEAIDNQLRLYTNDHLTAEITNHSHRSGGISLTIAPQAIVEIDDVSVFSLKTFEPATATPIPTATLIPSTTPMPTLSPTATVTLTSTPFPTVTPAPKILFQDDFETGDLSQWNDALSIAQVIADGDNHFLRLENTTDGFAVINLIDKHWTDYAFEASVRIEQSSAETTDAFFNMRSNADGGYGGILDVESSAAGILAGYKGNYYDLGTVNVNQPMNQWFKLRIQASGEEIKLYLNGELIQSATSSYSSEGGVSFTVAPHTIVEIDDVQVIEALSGT